MRDHSGILRVVCFCFCFCFLICAFSPIFIFAYFRCESLLYCTKIPLPQGKRLMPAAHIAPMLATGRPIRWYNGHFPEKDTALESHSVQKRASKTAQLHKLTAAERWSTNDRRRATPLLTAAPTHTYGTPASVGTTHNWQGLVLVWCDGRPKG